MMLSKIAYSKSSRVEFRLRFRNAPVAVLFQKGAAMPTNPGINKIS